MKCFVLKPEGNDEYAKASRKAIRVYAQRIRKENSQLCADLIEWVMAFILKTKSMDNPHSKQE